jgi:hypothetical protein
MRANSVSLALPAGSECFAEAKRVEAAVKALELQ